LFFAGYKADVFEFISGDHTARNLMIRATRDQQIQQDSGVAVEKIREYRHTCSLWGVKPALEVRLKLDAFKSGD
jgi:hypothetical protein